MRRIEEVFQGGHAYPPRTDVWITKQRLDFGLWIQRMNWYEECWCEQTGTTGYLRKDIERLRTFTGPFRRILYRGVYSSFREAHQALPRKHLKGFGHTSVVEYFEADESEWHYHDYPVAFWLRETLKSEHTIFDLGGGYGQTYYAYQRHMDYSETMRWIVCDVEAFAQRGIEIATERGATKLEFTVDIDKLDGCGILLTGGTLHYLEDDLPDILCRQKEKPRYVIVNRVPLTEGPRFTVQRMHRSFAVNKVMNRGQFLEGMGMLGYRLADDWGDPRSLNVIFHPEKRVNSYSGFYFCLHRSS